MRKPKYLNVLNGAIEEHHPLRHVYARLARRDVVNTFFIAPNVGLFTTLTIPPLYVLWMTAAQDDMFIAENWSIILVTCLYYALNINVNLLGLWHAKRLKTRYAGVAVRRGQL